MPQITKQQQSYSTQWKKSGTAVDYQFGNGVNWMTAPNFSEDANGNATITMSPCTSYHFDCVGGQYVPSFGAKQGLSANSSNHTVTMTDCDGSQYTFNDFGQTTNPQGSFKQYSSPGGETLQVTDYSNSRITKVRRSPDGGTTIDEYFYEYYTSGANNGLLHTVTHRRSTNSGSTWTDIRQAEYDYHSGSDTFGSSGDLKTAIQNVAGSWTPIETYYYRYYKAGETHGFAHAIKFVMGPEACRRCTGFATATDTTLKDFADNYFEYDSSRRVTKSVVNGGLLTYTFSYTDNTDTDDYNNWKRKTTITRPDNSQELVYTNHIGQELIREHRETSSSSRKWIEYNVYGTDSNSKPGLLLEHWMPSAVASYVDNGGTGSKKIVVTPASGGLIHVYDYATSTTATSSTAGDAKGYLKNEKIKNGNSGTPITLRALKYFKRTVGSYDIFPLGESTVYKDTGAAQPITTKFAYTWQTSPDTFQMKTRTTNLPKIPTSQNGAGDGGSDPQYVRRELFDTFGNMTATQDERGYINTQTIDAATGGTTKMVQDDDAPSSSGWTANSGTRLKLTTDITLDTLGRHTQSLGPSHTIDLAGTATGIRTATWTIYDEVNNETRTGQGYATGTSPSYTYTLVNPVSIIRTDDAHRTIDVISATKGSNPTSSGALVSTDTFAQSTYVRWTHTVYNDQSQMTESREYFAIPTSGEGDNTNYNKTSYGYETAHMGRPNMVKTPGGTITRTVYDVRGNATEVWVGTNDAGATDDDPNGSGGSNNMLQTMGYEYDGGSAGKDGNLTQSTALVDSNSSNNRETDFGYDFRNRQTSVDGEIDFYLVRTYDNLDRVTQVDRKDTSSSGHLIARSQTNYDDFNRVYQSVVVAVDPSTGSTGNSLTDNNWYDPAGNVLKQKPAGASAWTKFVYDSVGRQTKRYQGYSTATENYSEAGTIDTSIVFEQMFTTYDDAGNVIQTDQYQRFHDAPSTGTGSQGGLNLPTGSDPKARVTYTANYPDGVGRTINGANYGTNDNASFTRSATVSARSDTILVSTTDLNARGEGWQTTDPKATVAQQTFDDAARRTKLVENYVSGGTADDQNRTTEWTYNADGNIATLKAKNSTTGDQTTSYSYGVTVTGGSEFNSNDPLHVETYPDSGTVTHEYDRQLEQTKLTDQNGTVHTLVYDKLGRRSEDRVTLPMGSSVDGAVLRVATAYEVRGLVQNVTQYDAAASGNVVNDVQRAYNTFQQRSIEYQEHGGAVNTSTSPKVQYAYADGSANTIRRTEITYPDAGSGNRKVTFGYGSSGSVADKLSRVADLSFAGTSQIAAYTYLGLGTFVQVDYTEPDVRWDLITGSGSNPYAGLDRFGRLIDNLWRNYATSTDIDRIKHGYDRASNRLWRENTVSKNLGTPKYFDELYSYDGLYRLTDQKRGQLSGSPPSSIANLQFHQNWQQPSSPFALGLDPTGNWKNFNEDSNGDGSYELQQTRTANAVNEITDVTNTVGSAWIDPAYDSAGNMTTMPQPAAPGSQFLATFDAWNRMVKLTDGTNTVQENGYDGLTRRTIKKKYASGSLSETRHYYCSDYWQVLEERVGTATTYDRQFVWGLRYIDNLVCRDRATGNERFFALHDPNWNIDAIVNSSGTVQERYSYSGYGIPVILDANFTNPSGTSNYGWEATFAAYRCDWESGLYLVQWRSLHPLLGLWITRDPLRDDSDGTSRYGYTHAMPTTRTDPSGLIDPDDRLYYDQKYGPNPNYIGGEYRGTCNITDCTPESRDALLRATKCACSKIHGALYVLESLWSELASDLDFQTPGAGYVSDLVAAGPNSDERAFFINTFKSILNVCTRGDNVIQFKCVPHTAPNCNKERDTQMYTFPGLWGARDPMYVCPSFFGKKDQCMAVAHEMGRRFGWVFELSGNYKDNIHIWDAIVKKLDDRYDKYLNEYEKKNIQGFQ